MGWVAAVCHTEQASHEGSREGFGHLDLGSKPKSVGTSEHKSLRRQGKCGRERAPGPEVGSPSYLSTKGWWGAVQAISGMLYAEN